jgi:KRAB domain-containing zinc finger protein
LYYHDEGQFVGMSRAGIINERGSTEETGEVVRSTFVSPFVCDVCGKGFPTRGLLINHRKIHSGVKLFQCDDCGLYFERLAVLKRHNLVHTGELPFQCDKCGQKWNRRYRLKKHRCVPKSRAFAALELTKPASTPSVTEPIFQQETEEITEPCSSQRFFHEKPKVEPKTKAPWLCPDCGKLYASQSSLIAHRKIHTGIKAYECEVCGMRFVHFRTLSRHQLVHTGELPFKCEKCGKRWNRKYRLKNHKCVPLPVTDSVNEQSDSEKGTFDP